MIKFELIRQKLKLEMKFWQLLCLLGGILLLPLFMTGQVTLNVEAGNYKNNEPVYVTSFSDKDKKTVVLTKGKGQIELIQYAQYVLVVYQKGREPYAVSIDTENPPRTSSLRFAFLQGEMDQNEFRPQKHMVGKGSRFSTSSFDLDQVKDKGAFAYQMQLASREIKSFYKNGTLPPMTKNQSQYDTKETMRKSEHQIGQEIYKMLSKKRALELDLERWKKGGYAQANVQMSKAQQVSICERNLKWLQREQQYADASKKLAELEVEKAKMMLNRQKRSNQATDEKDLQQRKEKLERASKQFEIADLNYKNNYADCWALRLQGEIDASSNENEKQVKKIEISNVRIQQRKENAFKLNRLHNALATQLTGRERRVELANAQKFASDHTKANYTLAINQLKKLQITETDPNSKRIKSAKLEVIKKEEIAFQAEMSYLEHMWHLRSDQDMNKNIVDDLYARQTQLLPLENIRKRERPEDFVPGYDASDPILEQAQKLFDHVVKISQEGDTQKVEVLNDKYEIIQKSNGKKAYSKNGKPITSLTYRFETIRVYGEYLNNIRIEEKKRKTFLDYFKNRTSY